MDWGDRECCGCLIAVERGDQADLVCNECGAVVGTIPTSKVQFVMTEMSLANGVAGEICPHCGAVNLFPGFTSMEAYVCCECGQGVAKQTEGR